MDKKHIFLVFIALMVIGIFVFFNFANDGLEQKFSRVTIGMTTNQVEELLGAPDRIRQDSVARTAFFYGGLLRFRFCTMEVFFGADGRVIDKFHDH